MKCDIYRSKLRKDTFLFVESGTLTPQLEGQLYPQLGELELFKTRDIAAGQNLIGASAEIIINGIENNGFHIQQAAVVTQVSEGGAAIGGGLLGASVGGPVGAVIGAAIGFALAGHAKKVPNDL